MAATILTEFLLLLGTRRLVTMGRFTHLYIVGTILTTDLLVGPRRFVIMGTFTRLCIVATILNSCLLMGPATRLLTIGTTTRMALCTCGRAPRARTAWGS